MTDNENMIKIAGVRFRENWKVYDFDATDLEVAIGDKIIVDSERGLGFAVVVRIKRQPAAQTATVTAPAPAPVQEEHGLQYEEEVVAEPSPDVSSNGSRETPKSLRKMLRKATEDDLAREEKNQEREAEAFKTAQDMISERELQMRLIRVEYSFDATRATFYFFSESRVDFRELVKDLAHKLRSRIEMRQIGVRDVARMIGGFGPCGRELCCSAFLKNFEPVSIRMAKKQEMVLNPAKISGVCGRLLCCLSYEYEMYDEIKKDVAGMREAVVKVKREEEERRITEVRREEDERRQEEDKRRQDDRKQQEQRREKQREGGQKGGGRQEKKKDQQPDKKKEQPQEKKAPQPGGGQPRDRQQQRQQQPKPKPERQRQQVQATAQGQTPAPVPGQAQEQEPKTGQPQQEGDSAAKRKKRRFWRKKKKGPGGDGAPQGGPAGPA